MRSVTQIVVAPYLIALLCILTGISAQDAAKTTKAIVLQNVQWGPNENTAVLTALADLGTVDPVDRLFMRYIWVCNSEREEAQTTALVANYISRATTAQRPLPIVANGVTLLRLDLRLIAPQFGGKDNDLNDMIKTWEEFQFDPKLNLLLTADTLKFALGLGIDVPQRTVKKQRQKKDPKTGQPLFYDGGRGEPAMEDYDEVTVDVGNTELIRAVSNHMDKKAIAALVDGTRSQAPVVSSRYFLGRALTAIKDKGIYKTIYGGLYYDLAGIKTGFKKGTDEDNLFERLGVGNVEAGVTAKKLFDQLRSDKRIAKFTSGVTGKPRRVDLLRTLANGDEESIISVTHDLRDQDIDIGNHPMMNLLEFKDFAREVIWTMPNGLHGFALFNGDGKRVDEAPPDVAHDRTVPAPYSQRLQPAVSCIRCHKSGRGWQPLENDVKKLLANALDIFDDQGDKKAGRSDVLDRLVGLYGGDPEFKLLPRGRDDYASAVLRTTGPWAASKVNQTDVVVLASAKIGDIYKDHHYETVDAWKALGELGISGVDKKDAIKVLSALLPPIPTAHGVGFIPEDPRIGALKSGLGLPRTDWDLVYSFVATRAQLTMRAVQQQGAKK
jgi:hypothetical protein